MLKLSFHFQVVEFLKLIIRAGSSLLSCQLFTRTAPDPALTQVSSARSAGNLPVQKAQAQISSKLSKTPRNWGLMQNHYCPVSGCQYSTADPAWGSVDWEWGCQMDPGWSQSSVAPEGDEKGTGTEKSESDVLMRRAIKTTAEIPGKEIKNTS